MNKTQLIHELSIAADTPKATATKVLESLITTITTALKNEDQVVLPGFGTFHTKDRPARMGRNPQTGAALEIKAARLPGFKAGKALKDAVKLDAPEDITEA